MLVSFYRMKFTRESFIKAAKNIYGDKYDYSLVEYKNTKTKIKIICPVHGVFEKLPHHFLNGSECKECKRERKIYLPTLESFLIKAQEVHVDKYDYSLVKYKNNYTNIKIICPEHGVFEQTPYSHIKYKRGCNKCSIDNRKLTTTQVIKKCKEVHGDKYDYSLVDYKDAKTKIKIICPEHGVFETLFNTHISGNGGCPHCKIDKLKNLYTSNSKEFIEKAQKVHGDKYDYSLVEYISCYKKVKIICPEHGVFEQQPNNHLTGYGCPSCGVRKSSYEDYVRDYLDDNNITYIQHEKNVIDPLELDFYLPGYNTAIEVNGVYWHSEINGKKTSNYHLHKTELCKKLGIRLIHISDYEIDHVNIMSYLNSVFNINKRKLYARKCEVREIETPLKSKFLKKYHLQGNDSSSIKLGLFYNNKLVSVMTFCKYRLGIGSGIKKDGYYELSRFCNNNHFYIIGGASKLLKYFERNYTPKQIKTYADKMKSVGQLYFKLGFTHTHDSKPNYWYFDLSGDRKIYHRFNYRKSELNKKLKNFDPNKSEWQNMKDNGWDRYWDCGTMVFEKVY